jgi:hypothetical protein
MRTRIFLSFSDRDLEGKYPPDAEHIHITLDSSGGEFSVMLPDIGGSEQKEFIFYNVPSVGSGNNVAVYAKPGQYIYRDSDHHDLVPGDSVGFTTNLKKNWLITDINSGGGGGVTDHTLLSRLNSVLYWHLTQAQAKDLTDGGSTTLHRHDSLTPSGFTGTIVFVE